ncbi:MAG TPA: 50S ribosomal protein L1 [Acidimicrobiia bacterium]|nr:50S ribosomal protein L1 [Acidimicrobiia bacterium]
MAKSKNQKSVDSGYDKQAYYNPDEALRLVRTLAFAKFDESIDLAFQLGIDGRQADQIVRGTVSLPNGTGKNVKIAVFAESEQAREAEEAGADIVGGEQLADDMKSGKQPLDFDVVIATPSMMSVVGKLGPVLGPRGLMPNPKSGTITQDVGKTVEAFKAGRVEYRNDRYGNVHLPIGRVSFEVESLLENLVAASDEIFRARPASTKGRYVRSATVSSTMGPGVKIEFGSLEDVVKGNR